MKIDGVWKEVLTGPAVPLIVAVRLDHEASSRKSRERARRRVAVKEELYSCSRSAIKQLVQ